MQQLLRVIEKNIDKLRFMEGGWSYHVDLKNSCIASDQYSLLNAMIYGEGSIHDIVRVRVQYFVHNSQRTMGRCKKFRHIERAILYIWDFPDQYRLCQDCCRLIKKEEECEACIFYKSFMIHKSKKQNCGICQEECFRICLECKHYFHKSCLIKMSPIDMKCPLCRHPVSDEVVSDLFDNEDLDEDELPLLERATITGAFAQDYRSDDDDD